MPIFDPPERRQLKLFAWFLLLINLCVVGIGSLIGGSTDNPPDAWLLILGVGVLVNFLLAAIVGGDVLLVLLKRLRGRLRGTHADRDGT